MELFVIRVNELISRFYSILLHKISVKIFTIEQVLLDEYVFRDIFWIFVH